MLITPNKFNIIKTILKNIAEHSVKVISADSLRRLLHETFVVKNTIFYTLAIIGILSIFNLIFNLWKKQLDASEYLKNCEKVSTGMTLKEAKEIMGDDEYSSVE